MTEPKYTPLSFYGHGINYAICELFIQHEMALRREQSLKADLAGLKAIVETYQIAMYGIWQDVDMLRLPEAMSAIEGNVVVLTDDEKRLLKGKSC